MLRRFAILFLSVWTTTVPHPSQGGSSVLAPPVCPAQIATKRYDNEETRTSSNEKYASFCVDLPKTSDAEKVLQIMWHCSTLLAYMEIFMVAVISADILPLTGTDSTLYTFGNTTTTMSKDLLCETRESQLIAAASVGLWTRLPFMEAVNGIFLDSAWTVIRNSRTYVHRPPGNYSSLADVMGMGRDVFRKINGTNPEEMLRRINETKLGEIFRRVEETIAADASIARVYEDTKSKLRRSRASLFKLLGEAAEDAQKSKSIVDTLWVKILIFVFGSETCRPMFESESYKFVREFVLSRAVLELAKSAEYARVEGILDAAAREAARVFHWDSDELFGNLDDTIGVFFGTVEKELAKYPEFNRTVTALKRDLSAKYEYF